MAFTVEKHTAPMTGNAWFIVTEDNNGCQVDGTVFYDDHADATAEATRRNDTAALHTMARDAVISHGIDADEINCDSIDDAVFDGVFGEAVNAEQFSEWEAAEISDVLHSAIAETYWALVDEANGLVEPPIEVIEDEHDEVEEGRRERREFFRNRDHNWM